MPAAQAVVGADRVDADTAPMMTSEDIGRFLQHNARCDFNDRIVPSVNGISHNPREHTEPSDLLRGASVQLNVLLNVPLPLTAE